MSNDNELSNFDLDFLYSISNIDGSLMPNNCNIITSYAKDAYENQSSLEDKDMNIFNGYGHAVLFHRWDSNSAHWIPILRNKNNNVIVFDSLGRNGILKDKKLINTIINKMKENGMNSITFNEKPYQGNETKTCGKWSIYAISMNKLLKGADIKEIKKHLDDKKKKYKSYDNYILNLFSKVNV
jgi:hypothetical protein